MDQFVFVSVQYRIQFLDARRNILREMTANVLSITSALELIVDADWPPRAVSMRVIDAYGREVHWAVKVMPNR